MISDHYKVLSTLIKGGHMKKIKTVAYVVLLGVILVWGISFVSIKILLGVFSPVILAFVRFTIATTILTIIMLRGKREKVERKDLWLLAASGICSITLYFIFENNGILRISASTASIIGATIPIATIITDIIVYKTKVRKKEVISILLSIIGIYFVVGGDISGSIAGYLFMLGSVVAWCGYMVLTKPLFKKYNNMTITTYQAIFGTLAFLPFLPFESINWTMINFGTIFNLLFLAVLCSSFANFGYNFAMKELGLGISSLFLNLMPVVTILFSFLILGETLSIQQILGSALIIIGVYISTKPEKQDQTM